MLSNHFINQSENEDLGEEGQRNYEDQEKESSTHVDDPGCTSGERKISQPFNYFNQERPSNPQVQVIFSKLSFEAAEDDEESTVQIPEDRVSREEQGQAIGLIQSSLQISEENEISQYSSSSESEVQVSSIRRRERFQDTIDILSPNVTNVFDSHKREQKLITTLASLSNREQMKAIQKLPMTLKEKKNIRNKVFLEKKKKKGSLSQLNCFTQCLYNTSWTFRRFKNTLSEFFLSLQLWHKTLKVIGGQFGTSVLSYFSFLKWLLKFNIFSFIVNFSFITIPQCVDSKPNNLLFTGWEPFTGAGYFQETVMYYGFYTNSTITNESNSLSYNMQLAYIFTIGVYFMICFFSLVFSMAESFRNNFINPHSYIGGASRLLCSWDFNITNEKAVKLKQKNLSTQIKENLSERLQDRVKLPLKKRMVQLGIHLCAWVLSTGTAATCCTAVYYLSEINLKFLIDTSNQAATLLLPFIVCCINFIVPLFYSFFGLVEKFDLPRHQVYVIIIRNVFLKISIIGILSYYWLNVVAKLEGKCWETIIGQDIYRLLLMDFVFSLLDSLIGEYARRMVGTHVITRLGVPEFDIARNVLDLIYTQTLVWIGLFFSPLLPLIQIITLFIMFYIKKFSLMKNCQPPRKVWRASQMMTLFIFLLFFPSFSGVLCVLAITIWRIQPSEECGPFKGLHTIFHTIYTWIETLSSYPSALWVVWIYHNLIRSVHFFFILTLFVLIITYLYLQIIEGRKIMIQLLHEQIINEGKDKMFLLEKLRKLQETRNRSVVLNHQSSERKTADGMLSSFSKLTPLNSDVNAAAPYEGTDMARSTPTLNLSVMRENPDFPRGSRFMRERPEEEPSEALRLAMMARERAEMETRQKNATSFFT
ncbi:transmembrane channel-like protein 5 isoform X2 [Tachyglossus aculeatus]|uniref:transmembrane channel-like protein 5 isoform X2 n=1 Tax=Tachyglossus aculeatus TaxID=9261 RepID=UPI0018F6B1DB|nr:transmembrane channel-like protein 5 isoform X2 [Tachyglossus aculeatus]